MCPDGLVTIDGSGRVVAVETHVADIDSRCGVEFYSGILMPGMVNAHSHLELAFAQGQIARRCGFAGFAQGLRTARERADEAAKQRAMAFHDAAMWQEGIAAVGDISNGADSFGVKSTSNIKYHTFVETYGLRLSSLTDAVQVCAEARERGLAATLTPHSTYSLNEALFREAIEAGGDPLSVHFMESEGERELFGGHGAMAEWYAQAGFTTDFTDRYGSPAERIIANIPPDRRVMLVHDTCVNEREAQALAAHFGSNLTWVLCPRSNMFITGATPPVDMLRQTGCRIALGTDSLASNHDLSMVGELKALSGVPLGELLGWATLGGAQALGVDGELGSLEVGKRPGVVLLEGVDLGRMELTDRSSARRLV